MYKPVIIVTLFVAAICGYPTINDMANLDTMRQLEFENNVPADNKEVNLPRDLITKRKNKGEDVYVVKNYDQLNKPVENDEDTLNIDYLQPDWSAQGSSESDENLNRVSRQVVNLIRRAYIRHDDSDESFECHHDHDHGYDHNHDHDHDHYHHYSDVSDEDSGPDYSWEEEDRKKVTTTSTVPTVPKIRGTTISPVETTTATGWRVNIDTRMGPEESGVRRKRMIWNVARSDEYEENVKPAKMRWMWDDQKPEVVPPEHDVVGDTYGEKTDFSGVYVPVANPWEPCESKFERRDKHGRCRPAFF